MFDEYTYEDTLTNDANLHASILAKVGTPPVSDCERFVRLDALCVNERYSLIKVGDKRCGETNASWYNDPAEWKERCQGAHGSISSKRDPLRGD